MSDEKKDWHSWICSACPMRNTEHCNPCIIIATIGDELTREDIIRAEEAAKYKPLVEALSMAFKEADFLPANRLVRKTLSIFEPVKATLKALEGK